MSGPRVRTQTLASIVLAFLVVYVIWGSTYLAIKIAIESFPPYLMGGVRFMLAGGAMYAWLRWRGSPKPTLTQWRSAAIVGGFMLLIANGMICWAELHIASGLAALLVATVPIWMALLDWLIFRGPRPGALDATALALGLGGVFVIVSRDQALSAPIHLGGALAVVISCLSWSFGSLYSRRAPEPASLFMSAAMQLSAGGVLMFIAGCVRGEWASVHLNAISWNSIAAVLYLMFFGSIVAFTAYAWLLKAVSPAAVSTYAFVNPIVALLLGAQFGHEVLGARVAVASALILAAVVLITIRAAHRNRRAASVIRAATNERTEFIESAELDEPALCACGSDSGDPETWR